MSVKKEKRIHHCWEKMQNTADIGIKCPFGKYQYIYTSDKGKISLIELKDYFNDGVDLWEIYSVEGKLFEDIERFNTLEEAEKAIYKYLE